MSEQEKIAAQIFHDHGMDFKSAKRAGGWTNAVWLNDKLAIRVSIKRDSERIRREVRLSKFFPNEIGYPENILVGVTDGFEWSLSKRIEGRNLNEVWSNLEFSERVMAIRQILDILDQLHRMDVQNIKSLSNINAWYSSFDIQDIYASLNRYLELNIFSLDQINTLNNLIECFYSKLNSAKHVLNHGDITKENLIWSNDKIVSLLDFEHSVIAPSELDLHSIINLALFNEQDENDININQHEYQQYNKDVIQLLKPRLCYQYSMDLILGYSVHFHMRFLEIWLDNPEGNLETLNAYQKLCSLAKKEGNFVTELFYK